MTAFSKKSLLIIMIGFFLSPALTGCLPAIVIAGAAAGTAVMADRRQPQTLGQDRTAQFRAQAKINATVPLKKPNAHVVVTVFNGLALITGEVPSPDLKRHAQELVQTVPNVKRVYNELTIAPPPYSFNESATDAWITTKVKTVLLRDAGIPSMQLKVITENSTVYLMGLATRQQAQAAGDIARRVSGVDRVVLLFEYM
jgi:osmotically-inducible protein OsmY